MKHEDDGHTHHMNPAWGPGTRTGKMDKCSHYMCDSDAGLS
jgi:hypothetical protein